MKHLHSEVKNRVLQLAKNDPALLRKIFNDFDLNGSQALTIDEVTNLIAKLRISVERKFIYPYFKIVDANNSGAIHTHVHCPKDVGIWRQTAGDRPL